MDQIEKTLLDKRRKLLKIGLGLGLSSVALTSLLKNANSITLNGTGNFEDFDEVIAPATPNAGQLRTYALGTHRLALKDSAGVQRIINDYNALDNVPATFTPISHNILSAYHGDTLADNVVAGDIIYGNATPKWSRLPKTNNYDLLTQVSNLPSWQNLISILENKLLFYDDFIGRNTDSGIASLLKTPWFAYSSGGSSAVSILDQISNGVIRLTGDGNNNAFLYWGDNLVVFNYRSILLSKNPIAQAMIRKSVPSAGWSGFGIRHQQSGGEEMYFDLDRDQTLHFGISDGVHSTDISTGISYGIGWHTYKYVCSSSAIHYFYDGVELLGSPLTSYIPTSYLGPFFYSSYGAGGVISNLDIDYFLLEGDR